MKTVIKYTVIILITLGIMTDDARSQTDIDGIMMEKNALCIGPMAGYSSWKNYWEGTLKRDNENLGKVSTAMYSIMGNYGVSNKLNILFGLPYVKTKASAGQLNGQKGLQDFSLWVKWKAYSKKIGQGRLNPLAVIHYQLPIIRPIFYRCRSGWKVKIFRCGLWRIISGAAGLPHYRARISGEVISSWTAMGIIPQKCIIPMKYGCRMRFPSISGRVTETGG
jgi:hypothetical protein